jgi:hypothetical protein
MAVPPLGKATVTELDDEAGTLDGYRSPLHGRRPDVHAATSREEELSALVERVRVWISEGIEPHAIGIAARAGRLGKDLRPLPAAAPGGPARVAHVPGQHAHARPDEPARLSRVVAKTSRRLSAIDKTSM